MHIYGSEIRASAHAHRGVFCACVLYFIRTIKRAIKNLSRDFVCACVSRAMQPGRRNARPVPAAPEPPPEERGGYDYELAEKPPESLQTHCPICQFLLRDPQQLGCCGKLICSPCLEKTLAKGHESCPLCRNSEVHSFPDKNHKRMVEGLRVYCRHRPRGGCQWVGELGEVEKHLNGTEGCLYVRVACQQCKKMFLKCNLQLHISKTCPMTPVACEVEEYGCNVMIQRRAMARHMEHNHAEHLKMVIKKCKDKMETLSGRINRLKIAKQRSAMALEEAITGLSVIIGLIIGFVVIFLYVVYIR